MLTSQQVVDLFVERVGERPEPIQIELYMTYTLEELERVLNRRVAMEQNLDPTFMQRVIENYYQYMYATPEERRVWNYPDPATPINNSEDSNGN